jgi:glycosyltransferase involved in cell wall biosynthesis
MKIGIIAPSPVPFTVGGAEKFYWGLQEYINKNTAHQCELIKIPVKEDNFWNLIESYCKFYNLDVSHFDVVIASKYPAWMIRHNNLHIYMLHCLRGLYDTYDFDRFGAEINPALITPEVNDILYYIEDCINTNTDKETEKSLNVIFKKLFELKNKIYEKGADYQNLFAFPGPFIRKIIHFLDNLAMKNARSFSAISKTVADRAGYFPLGSKIEVIYPPSNLTGFRNGQYKYFFTASRLDYAKRVNLIIEAYLSADVDIPLKIAGTGPAMDDLKNIAKNDSRIEFLGFVSDRELVEYYANALAVIFIPYEEDYGLVTLEAAMCEKTVITFADSGGVKEFVKNGESGFVCEPSVKSLKNAIIKAAKNIEHTKDMGISLKKAVENINWENAFYSLNNLINMPAMPVSDVNYIKNKINNGNEIKKKKITLTSTYPIFPPRGGGQNRIFYLYKEIARYFDVELITLTGENGIGFRKEIAPNLIETRIPKSKEFAEKEYHKIQKKIGIPATDIAMLYFSDDLSEYSDAVKKSLKNSDYAVSSHPFTFNMLKKFNPPYIIHESHNFEYLLKKQMVNESERSSEILSFLFESEKTACLESDINVVCAMEDAYEMEKIYGMPLNKTIEVPNGVDLETVNFISYDERKALKEKIGLGGEKLIIFIGSWHQPNIDAVKFIINAAKKLPKYKFIVLGSVGNYFINNKVYYPENLGFAGIIDDSEKQLYLSSADLAINPMASGSGTNLKMLDYMAAGVPVLSTFVGARGLRLVNERNSTNSDFIELANLENFGDYIVQCIENYKDDKIYNARKHVEKNFDWKIISDNYFNSINF